MHGGFSLVELAIVVAITGLMTGFMMKTSKLSDDAGCYTTTRNELYVVKDAINIYVRNNNRYPGPANRNAGVTDPAYGHEVANLSALDHAGGVTWGALPFATLGLAPSYAGDCWGNKYTYAVTTALTTSNSSGGYPDSSIGGAINIKSSPLSGPTMTGAYAVISHGEDALGAIPLNPPDTAKTRMWCSGGTTMKYDNCTANSNIVMNALFNNGHDAGDNYFDDIVIAGGKLGMLTATPAPSGGVPFCWGYGGSFELGNDTSAGYSAPMAVTLPAGTTLFKKISIGTDGACAVGDNDKGYCWGYNTSGRLGDGTVTEHHVPTLVTNPGTTTGFSQIATDTAHSCGVASDGNAYCWGSNDQGKLGNGSGGTNVPLMVTQPLGIAIHSVSTGGSTSCGIGSDGKAYCWGLGTAGEMGDGSGGNSGVPVAANLPAGVSATTISVNMEHVCATGNDGKAYCWGSNSNGQLGDGTQSNRTTPVAVTFPAGVTAFTQVTTGWYNSCGIGNDNKVYCWGADGNGENGDNETTTNKLAPVAVVMPAGVTAFTHLTSARHTSCAIGNNGIAYCWGAGSYGNIGDGATVDRHVPTPVALPVGMSTVADISAGEKATCGLFNGS